MCTNKGWECPKCGKIYSPNTVECEACNRNVHRIELPAGMTIEEAEQLIKNHVYNYSKDLGIP